MKAKKKEGLSCLFEIAGQKYWQAYCLPVVQYVCLCPIGPSMKS